METNNLQQQLKGIYNPMRIAFVIVPIVAGLDKFTNLLTNWELYLNPSIAGMLPFSPSVFMMIVGVIEVVAGIIVWRKAALGGYIVAAWLTAIALTLLAGFNYLDVAVRDLVMALSAFSMAKLSKLVV
ncbi:hypothetical protein [Niabella hirudinis]|uniref:hypothetical protein n=1 Tax=Niabella hirudinis TaxID=1285929 RepID=UPI003EB7DD09